MEPDILEPSVPFLLLSFVFALISFLGLLFCIVSPFHLKTTTLKANNRDASPERGGDIVRPNFRPLTAQEMSVRLLR